MVYKNLVWSLLISSVLGNASQGFATIEEEFPYANAKEVVKKYTSPAVTPLRPSSNHAAPENLTLGENRPSISTDSIWSDGEFDDDLRDSTFPQYSKENIIIFSSLPTKEDNSLSQTKGFGHCTEFKKFLNEYKRPVIAAASVLGVCGMGFALTLSLQNSPPQMENDVSNTSGLLPTPVSEFSTLSTRLPTTIRFDELDPVTPSLRDSPLLESFQGRIYLKADFQEKYFRWNINKKVPGIDLNNLNLYFLEDLNFALELDPHVADGMTKDNYRNYTARIKATLSDKDKINKFIASQNPASLIRRISGVTLTTLRVYLRSYEYSKVQDFIKEFSPSPKNSPRVRREATLQDRLKTAKKGMREEQKQARRAFTSQQPKKHQTKSTASALR